MDPCHANFTHHGIIGRRDMERGSLITVTSPVSPDGFQLRRSTAGFTTDFAFQAPCLIKYNATQLALVFITYVVPTKAGYCRIITKFITDNSKPPPVKGVEALRFKVRGVCIRSCMSSCTVQSSGQRLSARARLVLGPVAALDPNVLQGACCSMHHPPSRSLQQCSSLL